jgi:5-methylcytosine-specific restriction endonuclease McrA
MAIAMYARATTGEYDWANAVLGGREKHRAASLTVKCKHCLDVFSPLYGYGHLRVCVPCATVRRQSTKRTHRLARKAMERAATVENVNPMLVFDRDSWRCRLCGIPTPQAKRGTYEPNAPELDHVVPLAKGGEHSYRNTQCACRRCNALKSDRLGFAGAKGEGVPHP